MNRPNQSPERSGPPTIDELVADWVANWESENRGPNFSAALFRSPVFQIISDESRLAEEPEREAYQRLVDGSARALLDAHRDGAHRELLEEISQALPYQLTDSNIKAVLTDIVATTFDLLAENPDHPGSTFSGSME